MAYATPSPSTDYGKELAKWEQHRTKYTAPDDGVPPGNPYVYREYPRMVYRAIKHPQTKQMVCIDTQPNPMGFTNPQEYERACSATEKLNRDCCRTVRDEVEFRNAKNEGWRESPSEALAAHEAMKFGEFKEAASRTFNDRNMSPEARAEVAALENATEHQIPSIPAPKKRRGRKPNAPMVTVPELPSTE